VDTLTHIVLGACIGEAIAGKQLGKKALILGAIAQSIPDIDFLNAIWLTTCEDLVAHRGYTHSILFVLLVTPFIASISRYIWRANAMTMKQWMVFWGAEIFIHIFLDAFNAYGTGWFEPFSHYRVSFNSMYVADPLFSIWPAIAFVTLLVIGKKHESRRIINKAALAISACYLLLGVGFKLSIDKHMEHEFEAQHLPVNNYFTTPTVLNNMLWYIVAKSDSGYYTGYRSIWDKNPVTLLRYVNRNASLLQESTNDKDEDRLLRFAQGYYTMEKRHDTLTFNILRFGEITGWMTRNPKFACYYYLQYPEANKLMVQRGRFENWNKDVFSAFMRRIGGN
jgi:inner membrane protein